jgi:MATE family multidrug resistance protein
MEVMGYLTLFKREEIGSYVSRSWSLSWPLTLIMVFEFLIGLTDVYIAGKVSKEIQATYGFVIQLYFVLIVIANALTVGTVSVVSRLYTSGDKTELNKAVFSSVIASTGAGIVLAIAAIFFSPTIIKYLNIPEELKHFAVPFIKIYAMGLLFHYLLINCNGILRSCQMVKRSLKTMALVCGFNIALNFFLVFHTPLGFRGIAAATASSVFIGSMINLVYVRKILAGMKYFSLNLVKKMINIGWPIGLLQVLWQLGSMVLYLILSALPEHRIETLAALTAGLRIESIIYLPVFGFNMANAVIVGNLLGEKKKEDAFQSGIMTMALGVCIVTLMVVIVILNARWIASFLSSDAIVIRESVKYIYISMISEPFMAWGIILGGGLIGAGDTRSVLIRVALSVWLIRIPLAYIFVVLLGFGAVSVWWSMNISQFVQAFLMSKRYFNREWLSLNRKII